MSLTEKDKSLLYKIAEKAAGHDGTRDQFLEDMRSDLDYDPSHKSKAEKDAEKGNAETPKRKPAAKKPASRSTHRVSASSTADNVESGTEAA